MPKYKNIRIKKKGGGSRLQRVQVLASGKYKFVKNPGSRSRSVTKSKTRKRRKNPVARRRTYTRRRRRRRNTTTIPVAVVGGLVASFAAEASAVMNGDFTGAVNSLGASFSDVRTAWAKMIPLFTGIIVHIIASKLGVNRILGRARVPFIRI